MHIRNDGVHRSGVGKGNPVHATSLGASKSKAEGDVVGSTLPRPGEAAPRQGMGRTLG